MKKITLPLFASIVMLIASTNLGMAQSLPNYEITLSPTDLAEMNAHPFDEVYYPAVFKVNGINYNVEARYKGSSSLAFPKKSWAIKFENTSNPFNVTRINLHADYNDASAMRNFLILKLCAKLGLPASTIEHVTYTVNGDNWGVYTQTEQIDNFYLARNGRSPLALYKGSDHGANLAPLVDDDKYLSVWEIEAGGDLSYNELRSLFNKFLYLPKAEFDTQLDSFFETESALKLYAVLFTFVEFDNFTKNTWVNKNSNTLKYELLPWDNEGSFGNGAWGDFDSTLVSYNFTDYQMPEYALLLQRMLENPIYKASFQQKVTQVLTEGMPFLDSLMDSTYVRIKDAVYADPNKRFTNAELDTEIDKLKWFMTERKAFLENNSLPTRNPLTLLSCNNPLPTVSNPMMNIRVKSPLVQSVRLVFADSVNYELMGEPNKLRTVPLFDDGLHNDLLAGDLIYGNDIDSRNFSSKWAQFAMLGGGQNYPANALLYTKYIRTKAYALNKGNSKDSVAYKVKMDKTYGYGNNRFVRLVNLSADTLDLSYCHIRTGRSVDDFMFRDNSLLLPKDTAIVAANEGMANTFFPGKAQFHNLYYNFGTADSLFLLSPLLTAMDTLKVTSIENLSAGTNNIIFTEINYSSATTHNTKDWVEIHNAGTSTVDVSGWIFRDSGNDHTFLIANGTNMNPGDYLVLGEDSTAIKSFNPNLSNVQGNVNFGLSSTGEFIRLYDNIGNLVDSVDFKSVAPWPTAAKGTGPTLELKATNLDNVLASSWFAQTGSFGTPGMPNHTPPVVSVTETKNQTTALYPNPTKGGVYINTQAPCVVELRSVDGLLMDKVILNAATQNKEVFNLSSVSNGLYLVHIIENGNKAIYKVIVEK